MMPSELVESGALPQPESGEVIEEASLGGPLRVAPSSEELTASAHVSINLNQTGQPDHAGPAESGKVSKADTAVTSSRGEWQGDMVDIFSPLDIDDFEIGSLRSSSNRTTSHEHNIASQQAGVDIIEDEDDEEAEDIVGAVEAVNETEKGASWGHTVARRARDMVAGLCTARCGTTGQDGDQ